MLQREHGITAYAVALELGIQPSRVMQIRNGRQKNIREARLRLILDIGREAKTLTGMVPAEQTRERLKAISATGLGQKKIGKLLGLRSKPRIARKEFVQADKASAVRRLYHQVVMQSTGKARTRKINTAFNSFGFENEVRPRG
jgi:hypothetical protein